MDLQNEFLSVRFTKQGIIESIFNKKTRNEYIKEKGLCRGWKIIFPNGDWLDCPIEAQNQKSEMATNKNEVRIAYKKLVAFGKEYDIKVDTTYRLNEDEVECLATIVNNDQVTVTEFWFPRITGLTFLSDKPEKDYVVFPQAYGVKIRNPFGTIGSKDGFQGYNDEARNIMVFYPGGYASMQWFGLFNNDEGLYLASHDKTFQTTGIYSIKTFKKDASCLDLGFVKYPFVRPNEKWSSEPFIISAHQGDWHVGAKKYRKWVDTWYKPPKQTRWIKELHGWQLTFLKHQFGKIYFNYRDIPSLLEDARSGGLNTLSLFGWYKGGHDNRYPEYEADAQMGGEKELRKALKKVKEQGCHTIIYIQARLIDPQTPFHREVGSRISLKDRYGIEHRENYAFWDEGSIPQISKQKTFAVVCPSNPEWLSQLKKHTNFIFDLGADGILWDQIGCSWPILCYAPDHPHKKPSEAVSQGNIHNLKTVKEEIRKKSENFIIAGEGIVDVLSQYVDVFHGVGNAYRDRANPEIFRYTFPEVVATNRIVDVNDYDELNFAFMLGYGFDFEVRGGKGSLGLCPEFAAYVKKLCQLREKLKEFLIYGTYIDDTGFSIDPTEVLAKAFTTEKGSAIVIWNPAKETKKVSVLNVKEGQIHDINGKVEEFTGELTLNPKELKVIVTPTKL